MVKNSDKEKNVYSGYGIAFDSEGWQSFDNGTARNVIIFGIDSNWPSHIDNCKNNFLILGLGLTYKINGKFGTAEKKI